jgi:hypothetical protein
VAFGAACGFGVAFGLHIGSGGGGGVVCGLPLRLEDQLVDTGYTYNQAPIEKT